MAAILLSLPEGADDKNIIRTVRFGETMVYIIKWLLLWRQPYLWGHAVVPSGVQRGRGRTGRRPRASEARGASTEWKYKTWNDVLDDFSYYFTKLVLLSILTFTYSNASNSQLFHCQGLIL